MGSVKYAHEKKGVAGVAEGWMVTRGGKRGKDMGDGRKRERRGGIPTPRLFSVRVPNKGLMLDAARKSGRYTT